MNLIEALGETHPYLVHFPVALIVTAGVAEGIAIGRRSVVAAQAARFMIAAAALVAVPVAVLGFFAAAQQTFDAALGGALVVHRIAGVATPVLALLSAALSESARRSGQVLELMMYRVVLALAVASVLIAGYNGGLLVHSG